MTLKNLLITGTVSALLLSGAAIANPSYTVPQVSDRHLNNIAIGARNIAPYVEQLPVGDVVRGERLKRDIERLLARLGRTRHQNAGEAQALDVHLKGLLKVIAYKANSTVSEPSTNTQPPAAPQASTSAPVTQAPEPDVQTAKPGTQTEKTTTVAQAEPTESPLAATGMTSKQALAYAEDVRAQFLDGGPLSFDNFPKPFRFGKKLQAEDVTAILTFVQNFEDAKSEHRQNMAMIHKATGKFGYMARLLNGEADKQLKRELDRLRLTIEGQLKDGLQKARVAANHDVKSEAAFLRDKRAERSKASMASTLELIELVKPMQDLLKIGFDLDIAAEDVRSAQTQFDELVALAASGAATELPDDIGDQELRAIAEKVLAKPRYEVGGWKKLIVNAPLQKRDRIEARIFDNKIEKVVRIWEQFQVTTVEADRTGKLFVYHNIIAKFSRAPNPTPTGEWILNKRVKGSAISVDKV